MTAFGVKKTDKQLYNQRLEEASIARTARREGQIGNMKMWLADRDWKDANPKNIKKVIVFQGKPATARRTRQRGASPRANAASGDSGSDSDSDGSDSDSDRRASTSSSFSLYDQQKLADFLCISKKTLQNLYSTTPHKLPVAISIPGARGPRWTPSAVAAWLADRPRHTAAPAPVAAPRKVGRPRIVAAQRSAGGAA
ncbi:hypothetical protein A6M27_18060 [Acidithiobacillus thiooxidans]|uniref:Uncharacterized protein n=1 Tax=Acidithiobacillus thiooxidans TaxID=930 RepID=A0A1C2III8_ACITH|nr:hypothetical protein [Acidithiobacillus thiooxidans]OCX69669.1 hypothetical protein A6P07_16040 [Acidithiobacillus thiooxidans]OCX75787.1 hypothetical protein A6O24_09405 [Acidithiobacillus thiooxidans]OCX82009.1 hypothetical protein A6O26_11095 [Acidithiobacillus thiooxidans]OCX83061.1 hypothetical protein A6M27_18060 [Acidithiobacillus thiooxidans]OFC43539.1 hypothetical protein BAE47_13165 [Acidithiobacillus thiooxidans]